MQVWLLDNYAPLDPELEATLAMTKVLMEPREAVQTFLNQFKTIVADLTWNDAAIVATLRTKLTPKLSETIHLLRPQGWPKTFAEFKKVTQDAENYIRISKRNWEDFYPEDSVKRVRFDKSANKKPARFPTERPTNSPYHERLGHIGTPNNIPLSKEDKTR